MSSYIDSTNPIHWQALVEETLRRRKSEKMTQREHAALANVSLPTMAAFEHGETTLSLAKAFDILRVVNLIHEPTEASVQDSFVQQAYARWQSLTANLPQNAPGRFPYGWYRFDYWLEGDLKIFSLEEFQGILEKVYSKHMQCLPFSIENNEILESWLLPFNEKNAHTFHYDYCQFKPDGRMLLLNGYKEDNQETFPPNIIFDLSLPIWQMGEGLLHAERLAKSMKKTSSGDVKVHFRAYYTRLNGRSLHAWCNPLLSFNPMQAAFRNEVCIETIVSANQIASHLAECLVPLINNLFQCFGVNEYPKSVIEYEVNRLLQYQEKVF